MTTENGRKINLNNIAVWVAIISIISGLVVGVNQMSHFAIQINNIQVIGERLEKKIKVINQNSDDIKQLKQETLKRDFELKLLIKEEEIKRLKQQLDERN